MFAAAMLQFFSTGALLGLAAGLAPGPLLTLVIAETLKYGPRAGIRVAVVPLITDLPIILLTLFLLRRIEDSAAILGGIALFGALFVAHLAWENLRPPAPLPLAAPAAAPRSRSLGKGILANFLSPHPYLFWLGVGAPLLAQARQEAGPAAVAAFIAAFYLLLVGSKLGLALITGRYRDFIKGRAYRLTLTLLGLALALLALALAREGLTLLGQGLLAASADAVGQGNLAPA